MREKGFTGSVVESQHYYVPCSSLCADCCHSLFSYTVNAQDVALLAQHSLILLALEICIKGKHHQMHFF